MRKNGNACNARFISEVKKKKGFLIHVLSIMTEARLPHGVQKPLCGLLNSPPPARKNSTYHQKIYVVHGGLADCTLLYCNHLTLPLILYMKLHYDMAETHETHVNS